MEDPTLIVCGDRDLRRLDSVHQRFFAIDGRSHRVLVYKVAPEVLTNGMEAMAVVGQPDFLPNSPVRLDTEKVDEFTQMTGDNRSYAGYVLRHQGKRITFQADF